MPLPGFWEGTIHIGYGRASQCQFTPSIRFSVGRLGLRSRARTTERTRSSAASCPGKVLEWELALRGRRMRLRGSLLRAVKAFVLAPDPLSGRLILQAGGPLLSTDGSVRLGRRIRDPHIVVGSGSAPGEHLVFGYRHSCCRGRSAGERDGVGLRGIGRCLGDRGKVGSSAAMGVQPHRGSSSAGSNAARLCGMMSGGLIVIFLSKLT